MRKIYYKRLKLQIPTNLWSCIKNAVGTDSVTDFFPKDFNVENANRQWEW